MKLGRNTIPTKLRNGLCNICYCLIISLRISLNSKHSIEIDASWQFSWQCSHPRTSIIILQLALIPLHCPILQGIWVSLCQGHFWKNIRELIARKQHEVIPPDSPNRTLISQSHLLISLAKTKIIFS